MTALFSLPRTRAEALKIGSNYYFTGKPCKKGHTDKRIAGNGGCFECRCEHTKAYYAANSEAKKERTKAWCEANREAKREYQKAYQESNRDAIKEYQKAYREANQATAKEYKQDWYESNKAALRESMKAYREANKATSKEYQKAYREANKATLRESKKSYYAAKVGKTPDEIGTRRPQLEPSRFVYFLVIKDADTNEKLFLKVGITNNPTHRLKQHKRHLAKEGLMFDMILIKDFETESAARAIEAKIKNSFIVYESVIEGFKSECFMYLPQFEASMLSVLNS